MGAELSAGLQRLWQNLLDDPDSTEHYDALLAAPKAAQIVQALPAQDVYLLAKRIGLQDASELVALASPEQFRTFVDLDAWRHDELDPRALEGWLLALRAGAGPDLTAQVEGLDAELLGLLFLGLIAIVEIEEEEGPPDDERLFFVSADRTVAVLLLDPERSELLQLLLDEKLAALGPLGLARYLLVLAHELPASLWAEAQRWRTARLADLGFPARAEAMEVYAPLSPAQRQAMQGPLRTQPDTPLPRWIARRESGPLLARALAELDAEPRARAEQDLVYLVNALLVASEVDPADDEQVQRVLQRGRGYLEVALEMLAGGESTRGAQVLRQFPLRGLFRFCATGLQSLMQRARRLRRLAPRLSPEPQSFLEQLSRLPPRRADGGEFQRAAQVQEAEARLLQYEAMAHALAADPCMAAVPAALPALAAFGTALARRHLELAPLPASLSSEEFERFVSSAFAAGALRPELRVASVQWLSDLLPEQDGAAASALAATWCTELEEELAGLPADEPPDPRFVGGVVLRDAPDAARD